MPISGEGFGKSPKHVRISILQRMFSEFKQKGKSKTIEWGKFSHALSSFSAPSHQSKANTQILIFVGLKLKTQQTSRGYFSKKIRQCYIKKNVKKRKIVIKIKLEKN